MSKYILSIDQGTTSTRAIIFDEFGNLIGMAQREISCFYPKPGWVEQDALAIWISVIDVVNEVLVTSNIKLNKISCIGITNQRETSVVWDKETGMPVYPAVVWQSRQSSDICDRVEKYKNLIHRKTGLLINPYFSASKIRFILDNIPNGQTRAENGELMFGTIDSWLIYKLTGHQNHFTDTTNASRTMLFNIHDLNWDEELLELFNIPKVILPSVKPSTFDYGEASFFGSIPISGVIGDQQAALFGHTCFKEGEVKNTYGTGCFMLMNIGETPILSKHGLLTTIAFSLKNKTVYALEGSVFVAGAAVQWLRDSVKLVASANDTERLATSVSSSDGLYVVPAFSGLGTPYWDDKVKGAIFGMTRGTTRNHIVRATLEAIAYQAKDVIDVMKKETKLKLKSLRVDGGAVANNFLMQFQADILNTKISVPRCLETTALGAAYVAGLQFGIWNDCHEIARIYGEDHSFTPKMSKTEVNKLTSGWKLAIKATRVFK